ncbi:MAG: 4Fe-4S binding protein [Methanosarcinales archaeon]|nr:4Fe-4S binding protein [Methanosarcinales archaeon]
MTIEVDEGLCSGAGECASVCPVDVFELVNDKATAPNVDECVECGLCVDACPVGAIKHSCC